MEAAYSACCLTLQGYWVHDGRCAYSQTSWHYYCGDAGKEGNVASGHAGWAGHSLTAQCEQMAPAATQACIYVGTPTNIVQTMNARRSLKTGYFMTGHHQTIQQPHPDSCSLHAHMKETADGRTKNALQVATC